MVNANLKVDEFIVSLSRKRKNGWLNVKLKNLTDEYKFISLSEDKVTFSKKEKPGFFKIQKNAFFSIKGKDFLYERVQFSIEPITVKSDSITFKIKEFKQNTTVENVNTKS